MKKLVLLLIVSIGLFSFSGDLNRVSIKGSIVDSKEYFQQHEIILIENGEKNGDVVTLGGTRFEITLEYGKQFLMVAKRKDESVKKLFINTDVPDANKGYVVNLKLFMDEVDASGVSKGIMAYDSGKNKFLVRPIQKKELKEVEKLYPELYKYFN